MTPVNYLACNISYLHVEKFNIPSNFLDQIRDYLNEHSIFYDEINRDIALRNETPEHLVPVMQRFFKDRFICRYLDHIYTNNAFEKDEPTFYPKYIFLKTERDDFLEFTIDNQTIYIGDQHTFHQEISALSNALGIVLSERDNYPGGKQKVAFNLIDISWSAINSSMPLIIF